MRIRLLGKPTVTSFDGALRPVRGHQAWAVLARVLLADRPLSRRQLAAELFPDTADPLGALRWCLAALRRALGPDAMTGDPLRANLPENSRVDVLSLDDPDFDPIEADELLEGHEPEACGPEFSTWLLVERTRIAARMDERLRRETLSSLSTMDIERALVLARHAVQRDPFDEGRHVLLVKALVLSGNPNAARLHVENVEADFLRELGEMPTAALRSAARASVSDMPPGTGPARVAETLIEAGKAALAAGAADAGIDCLRRAAAAAEQTGDPGPLARCFVELGTALIHSVRGYDDEGIVYLRQAEEAAMLAQTRPVACRAVLEQSYADALAGRRPDARRLSLRALELSDYDPECLAAAHCFSGFNLADWGRYREASDEYDRCLEIARSRGLKRRQTWALGLGAWGHLRAGDLDRAEVWAQDAILQCEDQRWLSFRPWPETVLSEIELRTETSSPSRVRSKLENTLALSCQLSDPCWEAAACRVIALSHEGEGQLEQALAWLGRALRVVTRVSDPYAALWTRIMLDQARISLSADPAATETLTRTLIGLAARTHANNELSEALTLLGDVQAK
ncbi:hypothetical protein [Rhizobium sullae]|uniref:hypothetical protein n=1 Tax=Rhizobium sullae TaxID=50338 RepID=UPI000B35B6A5|nr:hypothetical protein [Rhizobium sullae]